MSVRKSTSFKFKRVERLLNVIIGRLGIWDFAFSVLNKLSILINKTGGFKK